MIPVLHSPVHSIYDIMGSRSATVTVSILKSRKTGQAGNRYFHRWKTDGEEVHIPVVVDASGMTDVVYNDFYVAEGANVTIVAGCGIHNSGCNESRHDGIHTFHVEKMQMYAM